MKKHSNGFLFLILINMFVLLVLMTLGQGDRAEELTYQKFKTLAKDQKIVSPVVLEDGSNIVGQYRRDLLKIDAPTLKEGNIVQNLQPPKTESSIVKFKMPVDLNGDKEILQEIKNLGLDFVVYRSPNYGWVTGLIFPLLMLFLFFSLMKGLKGPQGGGKLNPFSKDNKSFQMFDPKNLKVSFNDVAGIDEAKAEVQELVEFLKDPGKFTKVGAKIPKGALLVGSPGTGKTMLAKAIACEAGVPFLYTSGSNFVEIFVGMGASRVRELFEEARKVAPCIIFIDEIDAVGGKRDAGMMGGGHSEKDQTLVQLLSEMDGFQTNQAPIIVLAATNRPEVLDSALKRPGRFDREVHVTLPTQLGRHEILKIHTSKTRQIPLASDVNLEVIARGTPGFSGAELENLVNEAALIAGRKSHEKVTREDFENARDKILMGLENKSLVISDEEKWVTAVHEAGHTLINLASGKLDPIHKVSIIPRGRALGVTQTLPEKDRELNYSKTKCLELIQMMMGGRVAEEIFFKEQTTGASNDIEQATNLARNMVYSWGMSELGFLNLENNHGGGYDPRYKFSEAVREQADKAIQQIISEQLRTATKFLQENKEKVEKIAKMLIEKETINGEDLVGIFEKKKVP